MTNSLKFGVPILLLLALVACSGKKPLPPGPGAQAAPTAVPEPAPRLTVSAGEAAVLRAPLLRYRVLEGDNLWNISAKPAVLGDPFRWPLLYRQNRDQVVDPDLIEVGQNLDFDPEPDRFAVAEAVRSAKLTPPFESHSAPRSPLPLKY